METPIEDQQVGLAVGEGQAIEVSLDGQDRLRVRVARQRAEAIALVDIDVERCDSMTGACQAMTQPAVS